MATYSMYKRDSTGDRLIENGNYVIIEDIEVVQQLLYSNLKLIKKDWFLDLDEGILYLDNDNGLLGASEVTTALEGQLLAAIQNTTGVLTVESFTFEIENNELVFDATVLSEFGNITVTSEDIVEDEEEKAVFTTEPLLTLAGANIKGLNGLNIETIRRV